jgi:hypothetical protein
LSVTTVLQTLQRPSEETLRRLGVTPGMNEYVEHNAVLIDGAPETMVHALDPDENFIHVPLVSGSWPAASRRLSGTGGGFLTPPSHRLIGEDNIALSQNQLDIPQVEAEHVTKPDGMTDDLGGEPMTIVRIGWRVHARTAGVTEAVWSCFSLTRRIESVLGSVKHKPRTRRLSALLDRLWGRWLGFRTVRNVIGLAPNCCIPDAWPFFLDQSRRATGLERPPLLSMRPWRGPAT